jgi:acetoin utilization deacetylase AcuC-like enzyme
MKKVAIVKTPQYLAHQTGDSHPESPRRLETLYSMLKEPDLNGQFVELSPRLASESEILLIHSQEYIKQVAATEAISQCALTADTYTSAGSYRVALLAAGGIFKAIEKVISGEVDHVFSLQRPPGHHAEKGRAMGFCLFNNVALGAQFAREMFGLKRVLIVDWDVHHGNGTQHSFERDASVLFFSAHQFPHYPGTGLYTETGIGKGEGFTINIPLSRGYGDSEYIALFERILKPVAYEYAPELILVSAGFDIHKSDPLGGMKMTAKGFAGLTRSILQIAESCCEGKVVFVLEGGYELNVLQESVKAVLKELSMQTVTDIAQMAEEAHPKKINQVLKRFRLVHRNFWKMI